MKTRIFENYVAFLKREDKRLNGVTQEFANSNPNWSEDRSNDGCWGCSDCSGCSGCSRCSGCSDLEENGPQPLEIPVVENIHTKVLEAVSKEGALKMSGWHSATCGTTHCRGGWVITLAGVPGKELESRTSSEFAATAIYSKSSPIKVSPVRFYEDNEKAMADIRRCAEEEAKLAK